MSPTETGMFPSHWQFTNPVGSGSFEVAAARLEDLFDAWVFAARDAQLALSAWLFSARPERPEAFAVYRAAFDREERAAAVLRMRATRDHDHA